MKKITSIALITLLILFIAGSAVAVPIVFNPAPVSEPFTMLVFGCSLIGMSVVSKKLRKSIKPVPL